MFEDNATTEFAIEGAAVLGSLAQGCFLLLFGLFQRYVLVTKYVRKCDVVFLKVIYTERMIICD